MSARPDMPDSQVLIDNAMLYLNAVLREDGEFTPFAITQDESGETEGIFPESIDGTGNNLDDFEALVETLRDDAEAGDHAAVVIVADAWIRSAPDAEPQDAIVIHLEHRDGPATKRIIFYNAEERPGDSAQPFHLELGEAEIHPADSLIFDPA